MTKASCGGNVTDQGASEVTSRGICWSTSSYPTILDSTTNDGDGIGPFSSLMTNLVPATTYYVRAYATNAAGTGYGQNKPFVALSDLTEMIYIEGGTFTRNLNQETINDFYIGKYEVTQELYQEIIRKNPSWFKGINLPVEQINWYESLEFCNKLSDKGGLEQVYTINGTEVVIDLNKNGYRLPTEVEWEYAARSGGRDDRKYSGTNTESELDDYAWYNSNSDSKTHGVGTKLPNDLGIYDMSGNVWEWCGKIFIRGGSWGSYSEGCKVILINFSYDRSSRSHELGLRIARNAK